MLTHSDAWLPAVIGLSNPELPVERYLSCAKARANTPEGIGMASKVANADRLRAGWVG